MDNYEITFIERGIENKEVVFCHGILSAIEVFSRGRGGCCLDYIIKVEKL